MAMNSPLTALSIPLRPPKRYAIIVASGTTLTTNPSVLTYAQSAYRHYRPLGAWGDGVDLLTQAGIGTDEPGNVTSTAAGDLVTGFIAALAVHRHWERAATHPTRLLTEE
ncbi:MAG: katE [Acidimicrobiia bacterium]|nr:katE [Acidimicrobiia bacterium]